MGFLAILGAVAGIVNTFLGILGQSKQEEIYKQQKKYERTQVDLAIENLKGTINTLQTNLGSLTTEKETALGKEEGLFEGEFGKQLRQTQGKLRTAIAGSGLKMGEGSAKLFEQEFMSEAKIQRNLLEEQYKAAIEDVKAQLETAQHDLAIWENYKKEDEEKNKLKTQKTTEKNNKPVDRERERERERRKEEQNRRQREAWNRLVERRRKKREQRYRQEMNVLGPK